jgi:hypothetical protein
MGSVSNYAECASCNCSPGYCATRERISQSVTRKAIQNVLNGVGGYTVHPDAPSQVSPRKNRAQRRKEKYLAKQGPPGKRQF